MTPEGLKGLEHIRQLQMAELDLDEILTILFSVLYGTILNESRINSHKYKTL